jgi:cytochrome P450
MLTLQKPYLNCVVQEVLRLRGPIPTLAPRVSPGKVIGGEYVPAGTIVSNLAYTTQRDAAVFRDPDSFVPDRWENPTQEVKIMHRPFSTGPRNCVGMHLARVQLLLTVCALYQRFDISLDPRLTENMMAQRDQGVMTPMAKQLWVRIHPRTMT